MTVLGVDACASGWVGVELRNGAFQRACAARDLDALLAGVPEVTVVGIDMPLGLLEAAAWRRADLLAAARLGRQRARVFRVAPRPVWDEADYATANLRCRELTGAGLSRQSWALKVKLREANSRREQGDRRLHEVHPEISFAAMNDGQPVAWSKRGWNGQMARRRLLDAQGIALPGHFDGEVGAVPPDDLLDACAAAWSAARISDHTAVSLPDPPERTTSDLPVAIWY
jgi:predicted RNase H-like nuclease